MRASHGSRNFGGGIQVGEQHGREASRLGRTVLDIEPPKGHSLNMIMYFIVFKSKPKSGSRLIRHDSSHSRRLLRLSPLLRHPWPAFLGAHSGVRNVAI